MFVDPFIHTSNNPTSPAETCFEIIPNDSADIQMATKAIYVGQGGNLAIISVRNESPVTFTNIAPGSILDIRVRRILVTGTTAGEIVGLA